MSRGRAVELVEREYPGVVALRRALHRDPELSHREERTSARVVEELRSVGVPVERPTPTSVLGRIRTGRPGPVLVLRADLDALPVHEATGLPFASANPGVMHACGHDGHTAVLLGVARALAPLAGELVGEVRLLFQHAEEPLPSGAPELIERGVLDGASAVIGQHLWTPLPVGRVAVPDGPLMASTDYFGITITGRGGHAGLPHQVVDPISVGAALVPAVQQLAARCASPSEPVVVAVTAFRSGEQNAVVPDSAVLRGTVRAFREEPRAAVEAGIERVARGIAAAHGAQARVDYQHGSPPVCNDPELAGAAREIVGRGPDALAEIDPVMVGEDFAWYQRHLPGVFALVGAGGAERTDYPHHHPRFDIDERALLVGLRFFLGMVLDRRPR